MTNNNFFNKHCVSGAIGLVGGSALIDKTIKKAQKKITANQSESLFSHAFIISEKRIDGIWWVIESDLEFHSKQIKLGVQENRIDKYFNETEYPNVAVLNFNLSPEQAKIVLTEGLNLVSNKAQYSLREIFGVLLSFKNSRERNKENKFQQRNSFICSSMVAHCYQTINVDFNTGVSIKNTTPEDIYATKFPHTKHELIRTPSK